MKWIFEEKWQCTKILSPVNYVVIYMQEKSCYVWHKVVNVSFGLNSDSNINIVQVYASKIKGGYLKY